MIHRIIKDDLHGRLTDKLLREYRRCMDDIAQSASVLERRAAEVEREAVKRKMAEYAEKHIGEVQEGTVSGVTSWGIYVQLDNTLEGLVHVTKLDGDYYEFDEGRMELRGTIEGRVFSIGQRLEVRIIDADPEKRTVDFCLEDDIYI
jgi:ribonuclease R